MMIGISLLGGKQGGWNASGKVRPSCRGISVAHPGGAMVPGSGGPGSIAAVKETDFTDYTLRVKNPKGRMVLSQGVTERRHDEVMFRNLQALTGLSLCMVIT
ncbi:MAG: hypothetical protein ACLTZT_08400 [Butyricimonas faecalis]